MGQYSLLAAPELAIGYFTSAADGGSACKHYSIKNNLDTLGESSGLLRTNRKYQNIKTTTIKRFVVRWCDKCMIEMVLSHDFTFNF